MLKYLFLGSIVSATASAVLVSSTANAVTFVGYDANPSTSSNPPPLAFDPNSNSQLAFNNFSSNLNGATVTTESFETTATPVGALIDNLSSIVSGTTAKFSYKKSDGSSASSTTSPTTQVQQAGSDGLTNAGTYPTDGSRGISINSTNKFSISFADTITGQPTLLAAFGYFGTDLGDLNNALTMQFFNGSTLLNPNELPIAVPTTSKNSSKFFFGYIADNSTQYFDRVVFLNSSTNDAIGIDQIKVGTPAQVTTAVPEPSSLLGTLLFGGSVMLVKRRSRRIKLLVQSPIDRGEITVK
jgi:hypothetical protein